MEIFTRPVFRPVYDRIDGFRDRWKVNVYTGNALKRIQRIHGQHSVPVKNKTAEILQSLFQKEL